MKDSKQQLAVVKNRTKGNLLVSASAGAGKTKVLVDRVVNELKPQVSVFSGSRDQHTYGIKNFLIVTFTRAAAKEMKGRIQKKLQSNINGDVPHKDWFLQQIGDLPTANIGTLDSFCQQLVQHYYYVIGLDPHFRILNDNTEVILLRDQTWKAVREDLYSNPKDQAFRDLAQNFFNRHINADDQLTDPLTNLVYALYNALKLYVYVSDHPHTKAGIDKEFTINSDPHKLFQSWANKLTRMYDVDEPLKQAPLYKAVLAKQLKLQLAQIVSVYQNAASEAHAMKLTKEAKTVTDELNVIQKFITQLDPDHGTWDELRQHAFDVVTLLRERFPSKSRKASAEIKASHDEVKDKRNQAKKAFNSLIDNFFIFDESTNKRVIGKSGELIHELVRVVKKFTGAYRDLKKRRHALEFIDIERAALQILYESPSVRQHLQRQFHEIMIDEYQDDNQLQDTIINLVAKHNPKTHDTTNVFRVGDVKQSIYRFRSADPTLFRNKYRAYRKAGNPNENQEITLSKNYRSTQNIDRFVNLIFGQVMDRALGGSKYSEVPEKYGAVRKYEDPHFKVSTAVKAPVNIMIYDQPKNNQQDANDNDSNVIRDSTYGQIEMVAHEIQKLVNNPKKTIYDKNAPKHVREVRYQDIALIASTRDDNVAISDVFRKSGIPVQMLGSQNYFKTTEIQIMLSLLEVIDNPDQDIPLVAVLRSPMVGLNDNQLAYLRINSKHGNFYRAVKKFNAEYQPQNDSKHRGLNQMARLIQKFLDDLDQYRKITQRHGLVDLIWSIYQTTGFLDYVGGMPAGTQRQANLHALYQRAAQYEQANFHGLFQFVRFIHQLQNQQKDLTEAAPQQGKDMVTSVTIHGSKGLEFPIVFLIDAARTFNKRDLTNDYILSSKYGLGIKYFDPSLHSQLNTLPYQGIKDDERKNDLAEEMRKLYVALTRAEQRLYIVGQATKTRKGYDGPQSTLIGHWEDLASSSNLVLNLPDRMNAKDYLDWIGASIVRHPKFRKHYRTQHNLNYQGLRDDPTNFRVTFVNDNQITVSQKTAPEINLINRPLTDDEKQAIRKVMTFKYQHSAATREGNYRSVSDVKQLFEDPNGVEMGQLDQIHHHDYHGRSNQYVTGDFPTPEFIQNATQPKPTEIGTATHLVLQMIDLHQKMSMKHVDDTVKMLVADQMIDPTVAKKVSRYNILQFFKSNYGKAVLEHPDDYHRETPFSMLIRANQVLPSEFKKTDPESILIHGIIDGYLYNPNNDEASIVDYKTDYVNFHDQSASVAKIKARYSGQLNLYGKALSSIIGHPVNGKFLYLLSSHQLVPIK